MKFFTKKKIVLFLLFIFPLICFLWLSTGKNNFTKLPVLTETVQEISSLSTVDSLTLKNNVSIIVFLGNDVEAKQSLLFNLNEKIYKKFFDYNQFQMIALYPENSEEETNKLKNKLAEFTDMQKWNFVKTSSEEISAFYNSLQTEESLENLGSSKAFIIDKNGSLRGRLNDEDTNGKLFGYEMSSVKTLKDKMKDDVSILYYEYYAALKQRNKNKADRKEVGL